MESFYLSILETFTKYNQLQKVPTAEVSGVLTT